MIKFRDQFFSFDLISLPWNMSLGNKVLKLFNFREISIYTHGHKPEENNPLLKLKNKSLKNLGITNVTVTIYLKELDIFITQNYYSIQLLIFI